MADALTRFYQGIPGTTVAMVAGTVPAATQWEIRMIHVANNTGTASGFTLHLVPSGGTAQANNCLAQGLVVPANGIIQLTGLYHMTTGDFLSAFQATANALTMSVHGVTVT